jgi:hypothetical protein
MAGISPTLVTTTGILAIPYQGALVAGPQKQRLKYQWYFDSIYSNILLLPYIK